jgi:PTS system galactitol-specific IIB component
MVAIKIGERLQKDGIQAQCDHCKVIEVAGCAERYDVLISNVKMEHAISIPVIAGLPFITGIGADSAYAELVVILQGREGM